MSQNEEFLNAKQVVATLKCCFTQAYKMIKRGQLPPMIKFGERMVRMSKLQLNEFLSDLSSNG